MGRKPIDSEPAGRGAVILVLLGIIACLVVYMSMSSLYTPFHDDSKIEALSKLEEGDVREETEEECCRGIEKLELWGSVVKWGTNLKLNSSQECCKACKEMCHVNDGPCLCDTWVFCGDKNGCGDKFGECWLKKQNDILAPDRQQVGDTNMWTSGILFGKGEGIISLETEQGTLDIKLLPHCSPESVSYLLDLMGLRSVGCHFTRAESRGRSWDSRGNHIKNASFGPPFGLIQGTLEAPGVPFRKIPSEFCPTIKRGSVAWVGSGPEFFISLANHEEWKKSYTVFGSVLPEDMAIADKIADLPTKSDVWHGINVSVLEKPLPLRIRRIKIEELNLNATN